MSAQRTRLVERRRGERDILDEFDVDTARAEQNHRPHFGIARGAEDELEAAAHHFGDQNAVEFGLAGMGRHGSDDLAVGGGQLLG